MNIPAGEKEQLVSPAEAKNSTLEDIIEPYSIDSESDLQPVANDNEPKQPDHEQLAKPEPVSDSGSCISSLNSAYSQDPTLLTPAERTLQSRAAHSRERMQKKHDCTPLSH